MVNKGLTKDPPGGTTGRVKRYRALGWMGARAGYGLVGEGCPLPPPSVAAAGRNVQRGADYFCDSAAPGCETSDAIAGAAASGARVAATGSGFVSGAAASGTAACTADTA